MMNARWLRRLAAWVLAGAAVLTGGVSAVWATPGTSACDPLPATLEMADSWHLWDAPCDPDDDGDPPLPPTQ